MLGIEQLGRQKERYRAGVIAWSGPGRDCERLVSLLLSVQGHARDLSTSASRTQARPKFVVWNANDQILQLGTCCQRVQH
jgi:hypothetical protein